MKMYSELVNEILKFSPDVRAVRVFDELGELLNVSYREDLVGKALMSPEETKKWGSLLFTVISGVSESLERYFGDLKRIVLQFEKNNVVVFKKEQVVVAVSLEKKADVFKLADQIEELLERY